MSQSKLQWNVSPCRLPPAPTHSSTTVEIEIAGIKSKAVQNTRNRFQRWLWHARKQIRGAVVFGAAVLLPSVGLAAPIVGASLLVGHHVSIRGSHRVVCPEVDELAAAVLDSGVVTINGKPAGPNSAHAALLERTGLPVRLASEWHYRARLNFGRLDQTEADKKCLQRWLGDKIHAEHPDMRTKDKVAMIDLILALYWVPRDSEIIAEMAANSGPAVILRSMMHQERA